jgi:hypothetical protein
MGEAKKKQEALRQMMLRKSSEWDFPPSVWEANLCAELEALPISMVPRAPADQLAWGRMKANECHANTRWYADNDPDGASKVVTGWWVQDPCYVLHSVIEQNGQVICITPSLFGETEIPFIADPNISLRLEDKVFRATRNDREIGPGVRKFPSLVVAINSIICDRLLAGQNLFKAGEFSDEELEALRQRHIES